MKITAKTQNILNGSLVCALGLTLPLEGFANVLTTPLESVRGTRPNIIFILADDLGYGELGAYGQQKIRTPHLDQMARDGVLFSQHYAGSPICAPSRSTLMSGHHTGRTPVRDNFGADPETGEPIRVGLQKDDLIVAEVLHANGYRTGLVGKWGLGEDGTDGEPLKKGFEVFHGFKNQKRAHEHFPEWVWSQDQKVHFLENKDGAKGLYIHDWLTDRAVDFIQAAKEDTRPFFLYLAYTLPHSDLAVPDDQVLIGEGPNAVFAAMVERLDKDIGRLRDYLRELGLADNTLVIFTADNGPHSQQGKSNDYFRASYPHRGEKRDLLEGGIRVPFLAVWPGSIVPGSRSAHVSAFWDFMPTACDLLGIAPPEGIDGISYLPALLGMPNRQHTYLYWEFLHKNDARQAIRFGDWKLLIQGNVGPQLFHLPTDPAEMRDLGDSYPVIRSALLEALPHLREPHPLFPFTPRF